MNIILIGPVSGNIERAKRVFATAERAFVEEGHVVVQNPMRDHVGGKSEAEYMQESLSRICQLVIDKTPDLIAVVLPYWSKSDGAVCEAELCRKLKIMKHSWEILPLILAFAITAEANGRAIQ